MKSAKLVHALLRASRRFVSPPSFSARSLSCLSLVKNDAINCRNSYPEPTLASSSSSSSSILHIRLFNTSSYEDKGYKEEDTFKYEATDDVEVIDEWEEEEEEAEPQIGDGGDGGGVVLRGVPWGERALSIAQEVLLLFGDEMKLFAFKTSPRGYIYMRLDKLANEYGCPSMNELERFSQEYKKRLDEAGATREIPDDLALEVSSPGAERLLKVPDDLPRFKDMPMRVYYVEETNLKNGVFILDCEDSESGHCVWKLADVRVNRDPQSKGRPLSRKKKDLRIKLPFVAHKRITLYLD